MYGKKMNRYMPQTDRGMSTTQGPTMKDLAAPSVKALEHDDPFVQEAFNRTVQYYELGSGSKPEPTADFWDEVYTLARYLREEFDPIKERDRDMEFEAWDPGNGKEEPIFQPTPDFDLRGRDLDGRKL